MQTQKLSVSKWIVWLGSLWVMFCLVCCVPPAATENSTPPIAVAAQPAATVDPQAGALATIQAALVTSSPSPDFTATAAVTKKVAETAAETNRIAVAATLTALAPTVTPTPTPTTPPTPDLGATEIARADGLVTIVAATLTAQPTATPNLAATQAAAAQLLATAVAATLTAQPTITPNLAATQTEQAHALETAIAATLTARPTLTLLPTLTTRPTDAAPSPTPPAIIEQRIGQSVLGAPIEVYQFGNGPRHIVLIGGLHAGFAPSTVKMAEMTIQYFQSNLAEIPAAITLDIIPNANPDSAYLPGKREGRLNANGVDLNRNWDCHWLPNGVWRDQPVSGGAAPFSEPETLALRDYLLNVAPVAVVFWEAKMQTGWSAPGGCDSINADSAALAELYGTAAGYKVGEWDAYTVNGDATNWLDTQGIPAISILILDYVAVDWSDNLSAMRTLLRKYSE